MTNTKRAPKRSKALDRWIGPQVVGGTYRCGYWNEPYTVLAITRDEQAHKFSMTVRWSSDGRITTHSTAWDRKRDRVISQPTTEGK